MTASDKMCGNLRSGSSDRFPLAGSTSSPEQAVRSVSSLASEVWYNGMVRKQPLLVKTKGREPGQSRSPANKITKIKIRLALSVELKLQRGWTCHFFPSCALLSLLMSVPFPASR